eukprot:CAMPEP_0206255574 /NCGR_PEP_ID=MMETSP0047_2-20121206/24316_1 /ASSEMBLY_ACC=CAM_ASM_000192 /TAXON_ID=195065 /ORGANISM="Chroomonas mesostigmatica_cf, Strain CCMP1168" /LENGTH=40 /DNA_ID= /DNA_START= /DNA_END= /DNA_ORIENTATION=
MKAAQIAAAEEALDEAIAEHDEDAMMKAMERLRELQGDEK